MLEYREFPIKKALSFISLAPLFAFEAYSIFALTLGTLFPDLSTNEHLFLLGVGIIVGLLSMPLASGILDRVHNPVAILFGFGFLSPTVCLLVSLIAIPSDMYSIVCTISLFMGSVFTFLALTIFLNEVVVIRYRGRIVALILVFMLLIVLGYNWTTIADYPIRLNMVPLMAIFAIVGLIISALFQPWKWDLHALSVAEDPKRYFGPTFLVLLAYMLWYFSTQLNINNIFAIVGESFPGLGIYSGLALYEPLMLAFGGLAAGIISDMKGRKVALNSLVLLIGLLSIFSSTFYGLERQEIAPGIYETVAFLNAVPLLIFERFIEGFMLALLVMLIWSEIGSPKTRAKRIGAVWSFLLIYIAFFWAIQLGAFGLQTPEIVGVYGREIAVLLSLVASYLTSGVPRILDREVEVEDLELNFDEELIEDTVGAFVGEDDFESIRSQLELGTGKIETPQGTIDLMSSDFNKILPFTSIPGIGEAMEKRLRKAGYRSAAQLAGETPARLSSKVPGLSKQRSKKILRETRKRVREVLERFSQ